MKIATFNVEFLFNEGDHKHSGKMWVYTKEYVEKRVDHLAKQISEIDADILFLQEAASEEVIQKIIKKTEKDYSYFIATPDNFGVGNAVLYKSKDCKCESVVATTDYPVFVEGDIDSIGPRIHSRRAFIHLTTFFNNKPLHLFGLHLNSRFFVRIKNKELVPILDVNTQIEAADALIRSETFRLVQARKMRQAVDEIFSLDKDAFIGVMGDFNSHENETPFRIIKGEFDSHSDSLVNIASAWCPDDKRHSFIGDKGSKLIDYILLSKPLEHHIKSFQILNEGLTHHNNKLPSPTFVESDHAPLVVELF